jgi:PKD repeat protein
MKKCKKQNHQQIKGASLLLILCFAFGSAFAQMNGSYTIDPSASGVATSRIFKDWNSFVKSIYNVSTTVNPRTDGGPIVLGLDSVSGPITVTVKSSNLTVETTALNFAAIKGVSDKNTIEIDGNFQTYNCNLQYAPFRLTGVDYLTIKNLTISNGNTEPGGIWFNNQSDYNTITGCTVKFPKSNGISKQTSYLYFSTLVNYPHVHGYGAVGSMGPPGSYNTISSNNFITTSVNSPGPYYGVTLNGSSNSYSTIPQNNTFKGNKIQNFSGYAIYQLYTNGNSITNNDISMVNSSQTITTSLYGIYNDASVSSSRASEISNNSIHDLSFAGSAGTLMYLCFNRDCYGNSNFYAQFAGNTFYNIKATGTCYGFYFYRTDYLEIIQNTIKNNSCNGNWNSFLLTTCDRILLHKNKCENIKQNSVSGDMFNFNLNDIGGIKCNGNILINNYSAGMLSTVRIYSNNANWQYNEFNDNIIENNASGKSNYSLNINYASRPSSPTNNFKINRNYCVGNTSSDSYGVHFFAIDWVSNCEIIGNVIAGNNANSQHIGIKTVKASASKYTAEIRNNTFQANVSSADKPSQSKINCSFYLENVDLIFTGNIIDFKGSGIQSERRLVFTYFDKIKEFDHNTYSLNNLFSKSYFVIGNVDYTDWAGLKSSGISGAHDNGEDPSFIDISKNDWRPGATAVQNNVPYLAKNEFDCKKVTRNKIAHDRGGLETNLDLQAISSNLKLPENVCAGYTSEKIWLQLKSLYPYDYLSNVKVSYAINKGPKVSAFVTKQLYNGDTALVYFSKPLILNETGANKIAIFIDMQDDNSSNDTLFFYTYVKPVPGGGKFTPSATVTLAKYQPNKSFDVTVVGQSVEYTVNAPRLYPNKDYVGNGGGNKWIASVVVKNKSGKVITGSSLIAPTTTSDLVVKFVTLDKSIEDSTLTLYLKVTDNFYGCDTIIERDILIYPTIVAKMSTQSRICVGKNVLFENQSTLASGPLEFNWDFGTGNPSDNKTEKNTIFSYKTPGMYKVSLLVKSVLYGFTSKDSAYIQVVQGPTAAFSNKNACEGYDLSFTNLSSPSNAFVNWDFGDLKGTSTSNNPTYKYAKGDSFLVTLIADYAGCQDTVIHRVYQLANPKVDFTAQSACSGKTINFKNGTTWAFGGITYDWDFSDNTHSTDINPDHVYTVPITTTYNVTLKARIDVGCVDSFTRQITVNEGPKTCDFFAIPDYGFGYYGMKLEPMNAVGKVGAQTNVNYTWTLENGSQVTGPIAQFNLLQDGSYNFEMLAVTKSTGCECKITKSVIMNRTSAINLATSEVSVYPNPAVGSFNIGLSESFGKEISIKIINVAGETVKFIQCQNNGLINVDTNNMSDGIYLILVQSGMRVVTEKIVVGK